MYLRIKVRQAPRKFFSYPQDSSLVCIVLGQTAGRSAKWLHEIYPCAPGRMLLITLHNDLFMWTLKSYFIVPFSLDICASSWTVSSLATILWTLRVGFSNLLIKTRVKSVLHPRIQGTLVFITYASLILGPFIPLSPISNDVESESVSHSVVSNSLRPRGL